ncbi:DNA topoisomerase large subunit [Pectobacterium phage POP12]|nr:DNA topoisomerase large subunit [Pectobacterium phage POP12]
MNLDSLFEDEPEQTKIEPKQEPSDVDDSFCLSDRDHIRLRPNMYLGSVNIKTQDRFIKGEYRPVSYVEGLVKMINEIIDNSLDEAIRTKFKHANKIDVVITNDTVIISDNGRGIPQDDVRTPSGDIVPKPVAAWTLAKAGSNFDDEERVTLGMNGVGSFLTNCFSSLFIGETANGKKKVTINCTNGSETIDYRVVDSKHQGTTVKFMPDFSLFSGVECIDEETKTIIEDRLIALAVAFPSVKFTYNDKTLSNRFQQYAELYGTDTFIKVDRAVSFVLASTTDGFKQKSFVNGLDTKRGGVHVDCIIDGLCAELIPMIKKKHDIDISKARLKEGLTLIAFVHGFNAPAFDGQTKEELTNTPSEFNNHAGIEYAKVAKKVFEIDAIIQPIIEQALIRKEATEKAMLTKANKKVKNNRVAKHVPANGLNDPQYETTLFLTEGDSAVGQLIECRDKMTQGAFPLRGKPLNTWGMSNLDVLKNKELSEMMTILNITAGDISQMSYDFIGIMVDADVDGGDILTLLIAFFARWPELFEQQRIRYIRTPLIIYKDKWFYSQEDFEPYRATAKVKDIRYIKGLGGLEKEDYERVLTTDLVYETIVLSDNWKEDLEMCFGKESDPRKEWVSA